MQNEIIIIFYELCHPQQLVKDPSLSQALVFSFPTLLNMHHRITYRSYGRGTRPNQGCHKLLS